MATTSRKKNQVIAEIKKVEVKDKEFLEPSHLLGLETLSRDIENSKLSMALEEQNLQTLLLSVQILQNKIEKQRLAVAAKAKSFELSKQTYIGYKREIWPTYGLKEEDKMAYDPISGFIQRD